MNGTKGMVRPRGRTWTYCIDIGWATKPDGTRYRKQERKGGFRTKRDAQEALAETLSRLAKGTHVPRSKMSLGDYLDQWLDGQRARIRPATWDSYRRTLRAHVPPVLQTKQVQQLSSADLNALYASCIAGDTRSAISPRTTRYLHMIIRKALKDAERGGFVTRNVADQADPPRPRGSAEMKTWTADELRRFLEHVNDDRLYAAWLLASSTGARRGEVLGVRWSDLDLDAGRMAVRQTLVTVGFKVQFGSPKTDRGKRSIALDPLTVAALREHRRRQLEDRLALGQWPSHDLVFTNADGSPVHPDAFSRWFDQHVRAAGLPRIRLHDLRHSHASIALAAGIHPKIVSERLGHANVSITLNVYSHAIPAMQEEAAAKVAALVFGT